MATVYERVGNETVANELTPSNQSLPRITYLVDGRYVVTWITGAGVSPNDIKFRMFNADGSPFGAERSVNLTAGNQLQAGVGALTNGGFVIVFASSVTQADIVANVFDASGTLVTAISVNDPLQAHNVNGDQVNPFVTGLTGGRFAVVWSDYAGSDGSGNGIRTRVFNADGSAVSADTLVNTQTLNSQQGPAISTLGTGYVVTWQDGSGAAGQGVDIRAQRYDLNGAKIGGEILVTSAASTQETPAVTELANGSFVVAWSDYSVTGADQSSAAIKGRIFSAAGVATGAEFLLNSTTLGAQQNVTLARLNDGGFVAAWGDNSRTGGDTSSSAVRSRTFDLTGAATGPERLVNTVTSGAQVNPAVAADGAGNHTIVYADFSNVDSDIRFQRFQVDTAPALTGVATAVTFGENTVNATPQLLDADVTFTDTSMSLAGGTLTVSGLLAEDRLGVRNEGVGAGQIGVSGTDVTYGGVSIGTLAGGVGSMLTVALNGSATSIAVDALIQNLTYANTSDTPTATRTLLVNVIDAAGRDVGQTGDATFTRGGVANPFAGVGFTQDFQDRYGRAAFIDLDGDGDLDAILARNYGPVRAFRAGTAGTPGAFTEITTGNPFAGVTVDRGFTTTADLDGDGDLDVTIAGGLPTGYGARTFVNTAPIGSAATFVEATGATNPFNGVSFAYQSAVGYIDLDGDGDLDAVVGAFDGTFRTFRNTAPSNSLATFVELTGTNNPLAGRDTGNYGTPTFFDYDGDGDLDLVSGSNYSGLQVYRNVAAAGQAASFSPATGTGSAITGSGVIGQRSAGNFIDLDGDGDLDFVAGSSNGGADSIQAFRNDAQRGRAVKVTVTAQDDAPVPVADSAATPENAPVTINLTGNDTDVDGGSKTITAINGTPVVTGTVVTLASGARVTNSGNGSVVFNPNGAFDTLAAPGSGAVNTSAVVGFTYTVNNANTGNVTVTVGGVDSNDTLQGSGSDDVLDGGIGNDRLLGGAGNDQLTGGTGVDTAVFTTSLNVARVTAVADLDSVTAGLQPGYAIALDGAEGDDTVTGVEILDGAEAGRILLVGNTGFADLQSAQASATAGDLILISGTLAATTREDTARVLTSADFGFVEVDGDTAVAVVIDTLPAGTLRLDAAVGGPAPVTPGQVIAGNDIIAGRLSFVPFADSNTATAFDFRLQDSASGAVNPITRTLGLVITPVDDAPVGTDSTVIVQEDGSRSFTAADFGLTDVDGGQLAAVIITAPPPSSTLTFAGSPVVQGQEIAAADLASLVFTPPAGANGQNFTSFGFRVRDTGTTTDGGQNLSVSANTLTIDVAPVNDSPELTTGGPIAATEQVAVAILPAGAVSDSDLDSRNGGLGDYSGASFSVNRNMGVNGTEDRFALVAGPDFTIEGNDLKSNGLTFATITTDGSAGLLVISFNGSETAPTSALVDEVIRAVRYTNISANPPASVELAIGFDDNSPGSSQGPGAPGLDVNLVTVTIASTNDAPVNTLGGTIGVSEDSSNNWLSGMSIADPDADPATDRIFVTFQVDTGVIDIRTDVAAGVTANDIIAVAVDTITVQATVDQVNATLAAANGLVYTPPGDFNGNAVLTVFTNDGGARGTDPGLTGDATSEEDVDTRIIAMSGTDDAPVAQPDAVSTAENAIGTGDLFANNGSGPDSDVDGDPISVTAINGSTTSVGQEIVLASGAKLTVNANGSYSYNPNGRFDYLVSTDTATATGATNTSASDSFTYTVNGGSSATVTISVTGVDNPGNELRGDAGANAIAGTPQNDFVDASQGGDDDLMGFAGNDAFYFGAALTGADRVDGGTSTDVVAVQGNYSALVLGAGNLVNVETLSILTGADARFGDAAGNLYDYALTSVDANVAAGAQLIVNASTLRVGEDFTFNGAAETDGSFFIYGGFGVDVLTGGADADVFYMADGRLGADDRFIGGAGADIVVLRGDYTVTLSATAFSGIETLTLTSASDTRFFGGGDLYSYDVTSNDGNVAAGATLTVNGGRLTADESMSFIGSAETNGQFRLFGGAGNDQLTGGAGADLIFGGLRMDTLRGGAGNDTFRYQAVEESTSTERDGIQDFTLGDLIDLSRIDADVNAAGEQAFSFIGTGVFSGQAGQLRFENISSGGATFLVQGDVDGDGVSDFEVLVVVADNHPITAADFVL